MSDQAKQETIDSLRELLITESDLAFLKQLELDTIKEISLEIKAYISRTEEAQKPLFKVMAIATKFMPNFIATKIAKDYLTPYVMAQISQYMEPKDAANLGKSFNADVLAQISLHSEPKLTAVIADKMGVNSVAKIVDEMIRLGFFHRLGEVSDVLNMKMLIQLMQRINNEDHLAKIAYNMRDEQRVSQVAMNLPGSKREAVKKNLGGMGAPDELVALFG